MSTPKHTTTPFNGKRGRFFLISPMSRSQPALSAAASESCVV